MCDELRDIIRDRFSVGYITYVVTVTFKPETDYSKLHPKRAHGLFSSRFEKYCCRKSVRYYMVPEIGKNGDYHLHGLVIFNVENNVAHEKKVRLFRNYMNRMFGRNFWQRVHNYESSYIEYAAWDFKRMRPLRTSYDDIWRYIHKEREMFNYIPVIKCLAV